MTWIRQRQSLPLHSGGLGAPQKEIRSLKHTTHTWKIIVLLQWELPAAEGSVLFPGQVSDKDLGFFCWQLSNPQLGGAPTFLSSRRLKGAVEFFGLTYMRQLCKMEHIPLLPDTR